MSNFLAYDINYMKHIDVDTNIDMDLDDVIYYLKNRGKVGIRFKYHDELLKYGDKILKKLKEKYNDSISFEIVDRSNILIITIKEKYNITNKEIRTVKIRMPANIVYEVTNFGYIKACNMFNTLMKDKHIEKKEDNVVESIENLLYDGYVITKAEYDMLTNDVILYLGDKYREDDICKTEV